MCTYEEERRNRAHLIALGPERLAEALLNFSYRHRDVATWVLRQASTAEEKRAAFFRVLEDFRTDTAYLSLDESYQYSCELIDLLETLESSQDDPGEGLKSLALFFKADQAIIERSDDSCGWVGGVFTGEAIELFVRYAARCVEKGEVIELLVDILEDDDYGVRGDLADAAHRFLGPEALALFSEKCREKAGSATESYQRSRWLGFAQGVLVHLEGEKVPPSGAP